MAATRRQIEPALTSTVFSNEYLTHLQLRTSHCFKCFSLWQNDLTRTSAAISGHLCYIAVDRNLEAWEMDTNANPQKKRKLPPPSTKVQSRKKRKFNALDTTKAPITVPSIPTGRSLDNLLPSILEQRVFSKDIRQAPMGFISSRATLWKKRRTPEAATTRQQRPPRFPEKGTYYTHRNDGINWRGRRRYIMKFRIIEWNRPATDATVEQGVVSPRTKSGPVKPRERVPGHWEVMVVVV